ncbi:hypothetical protein Btru_036378 [Bulinus truncatus]|nr:hypothetical protein Btru_036378 [Bulinus truncatus]
MFTRQVLPYGQVNYKPNIYSDPLITKEPDVCMTSRMSSMSRFGETFLAGDKFTPGCSKNCCRSITKFDMIDWSVPSEDVKFCLPPLSLGSLTYQLALKDFLRCSRDCDSRSCDAERRIGKRKKCTCGASCNATDLNKSQIRLSYLVSTECTQESFNSQTWCV